jgi:hypothetical protein
MISTIIMQINEFIQVIPYIQMIALRDPVEYRIGGSGSLKTGAGTLYPREVDDTFAQRP